MLEWNKSLIAAAFKINREKNNNCVILVAINTYSIGIDNPDIRLVIQQNLFIGFNAIIQRIDHIRRKSQQSIFVLLTLK